MLMRKFKVFEINFQQKQRKIIQTKSLNDANKMKQFFFREALTFIRKIQLSNPDIYNSLTVRLSGKYVTNTHTQFI